MRITTWAEYGLICALHLARRSSDGPITGRDIASSEKLPADYVEQILLRLRRADIVKSTRGAHGGYALARSADDITVRDVIQASELNTFDLHCVSHPVDEVRCADAGNCSIRPVWEMLQQRIDEVLAGVCLSDLLAHENVVRERVGLQGMRPIAAMPGALPYPPELSGHGNEYEVEDPGMSLLGDWQSARDRRRRAAVYLRTVTQSVAAADAKWLTAAMPSSDERVALRELRFAHRALGLIVAERDALDDRTASDVSHQLAAVLAIEARHDPSDARAWSERWREYTNAFAARGVAETPSARLAKVLLDGAGVTTATAGELARATQFIASTRSSANEALRAAYGAATLPDDIRPSALRPAPR